MRVTRLCFSCAVALAGVFAQGSWAVSSDNHDFAIVRKSKLENANQRNGAQGERKAEEVQRVVGVVVTSTSTIVVASPRITEPPLLVRRKLGSTHWDAIHEELRGRKREATICPADYQLCPQSLNGGCCPNDRVCGASSCLPTSSAASACGMAGYVACGVSDGGGCCPSDYMCGTNGCTPSAGISVTETCNVGSYLCPASFNYGCCANGMACALDRCYSTAVVSFTLTETITTTDSNSKAATITTTITSTTIPNAPTVTSTYDGVVAKVSASATSISKTAASGTPSSGLTGPQIGGIIGGAVVILLIILVVAYFIIKRLNQNIEISKANSASKETSSRPSGPRLPGTFSPDVDAMSVDPLMMAGSEVSTSNRYSRYGDSDSRIMASSAASSHSRSGSASCLTSNSASRAYEVEANEAISSSPPVFNSPFTPRSPPTSHYPGEYAAVAGSDGDRSGSGRNVSVELSPPYQHTPQAGYFDLPLSSERPSVDSRMSGFGRRPSQHGRNWSSTSDLSAVSATSDGTANMVELEAGRDGSRKGSLRRALHGMGQGLGRMVSRRRSEGLVNSSEPPVLPGGPVRREPIPKLTGGPARLMGLGGIPEAGESRFNIDRGVSPHPMGLSMAEREALMEGQGKEIDPREMEMAQGKEVNVSEMEQVGRNLMARGDTSD